MKTIFPVLLAMMLCFSYSCNKKATDIEPDQTDTGSGIPLADTCEPRFYYNLKEKVFLGTYSDTIIIGFRQSITMERIRKILRQYPFLMLTNAQNSKAIPHFFYVSLSGFMECAGLQQTIAQLEKEDDVVYATQLLFSTTPDHKRSRVVLTDEFLVGLKDEADLPVLEEFARSHNITLIEKGSSYFLLRVDKSNTEDALDMANHFQESGLFYYAIPNLLITVSSGF